MIRIAVTGGIACGKTTVGLLIEECGLAVCDADDLAHALMVRGTDVYCRIRTEFGEDVLSADGELDRELMGNLIFSNREARRKLNAIVHPVVKKAWEAWIEERQDVALGGAVIVPLLFEGSFSEDWDAVICVICSESLQIERLKQRGLRHEQAIRRIAAQLPNRKKEILSDFVLVNNGSKELLKRQALRAVARILEK